MSQDKPKFYHVPKQQSSIDNYQESLLQQNPQQQNQQKVNLIKERTHNSNFYDKIKNIFKNK